MNNKVLSAAEICSFWSETGKKKGNLPIFKMFYLGIFAGIFIGFGGVSFLTMTGNIKGDAAILGKLFGAFMFALGLMLVVFFSAELFTGNCLMPIAVLDKKITLKQMLTNWVVVYAGNAVGSYIFAYVMFASGLFNGEAMKANMINVAQAKVSLTFMQVVLRGVLCNVLVVAALWFQSASSDMPGKILAILFPIAAFTLCGYEHCVANMFMIPLGQLLGAEITFAQCWISNIIPSTIGNIIGGALVVAVPMYYTYLHKK